MVDPYADDNASVDSELVPSSLASIAPILRAANETEKANPRVAYLCMFQSRKPYPPFSFICTYCDYCC